MRRIWLLVFVVFVLTLPVGQANPANEGEQGRVSVVGRAEIVVVPDMASLSVGVVSVSNEAVLAKQENDRIMNQMIAAVSAMGIGKQELLTSGFSIHPQYRQNAKTGEAMEIIGYKVQNNLTIQINDLTQISPLIDICVQSGANQIGSLRFGVKNEAQMKDRLMEKALLDGKGRATRMAETLGVVLGKPLLLQFGGYTRTGISPLADMRFAVAESASSTPVSPGTVTLTAEVNMTFSLQ